MPDQFRQNLCDFIGCTVIDLGSMRGRNCLTFLKVAIILIASVEDKILLTGGGKSINLKRAGAAPGDQRRA
jgi:hypothetical protein